ncbi:MAG: DNA-directed RNA polymerase subunit G [Candidatus Nezhaarchaeales archaeon]
MTSNILLDVQGEVSKIEKSDFKGISVIEVLTPEGIEVKMEVPQQLLQIKENTKVRLLVSMEPSIEQAIGQEVDGLFLCTIYGIERYKKGKEERARIYGSIGGLQVRIDGKGIHKKVKMGDKVYVGLKVL